MSRISLATPCPAPLTATSITQRRLSTLSATGSLQDDTCTGEIDYTRAIQQEWQNVRPRRKSTFPRRPNKNAGITIFEDVVEDEELVVNQAKGLMGGTLLGRPAQRLPIGAMRRAEAKVQEPQPLAEMQQARTKRPTAPQLRPVIEVGTDIADTARAGLKKHPRRRTIFVPTDDTTMLTIHPGANTTHKLDDTFALPSLASWQPPSPVPPVELVLEIPQEARPAGRPRMSLAAAPKRVPLQVMAARVGNLPSFDRAGEGGGKENVPPGGDHLDQETQKLAGPPKPHVEKMKGSLARSRLFAPTACSQARKTVVTRKAVPLPNAQPKHLQAVQPTVVRREPRPQETISIPMKRQPQPLRPVQQSDPRLRPTKRATPPKRTRPSDLPTSRLLRYPVLAEDVSQPQLYEESWLSHQEIALSELINEIFESAEPTKHDWQPLDRTLRERMLDIYHQPAVTALYNRLQASLRCGALSRPKDMPSPPDATQDIGLRKRFLSLWLRSYDQEALRAAAEVVVGRQVPSNAAGSPRMPRNPRTSEGGLDGSKSKRALIGFLETFFVTVDDLDTKGSGEADETDDASTRRWRKTIVRSLMLVWLLEQAKVSGAIRCCLFMSTSTHKTSTTVLHALSGLLIPSIGDITRPLRHFEYELSYTQDPLDEVRYHITSLAVDLRDGICLNRLVEILLFSAQTHYQARNDSGTDATVTIQLPDTTLLESALYAEDGSAYPRVLSQHLKMPCLGRAQKVYNVQIALSALAEHGDHAAHIVNDITADDIVDGHREKTLSLLWALVSSHGMARLVDWDALAADVQRVGGHARICGQQSRKEQEELLQAWTTGHCAKSGLQIRNLTTSFADGKAYEAILASFSPFLLPTTIDRVSAPRQPTTASTLESRLRALGCSTPFIKQLTSAQTTIPSRTTTISNLAFLASRLLPLSRRHHAAVMLQRAVRRRQARTAVTQRVALARLAHACAKVVRTQQKVVDAAVVLQRAWRGVLDTRIRRLGRDVGVFQGLARGWSVRMQVRRTPARCLSAW